MQVFNRVIAVLVGVLLLVASVVAIVIPVQALDSIERNASLIRSNLADPTYRAIATVIVVVVGLLGVLVLVLEFYPRYQDTVRIYAQGRGNARLKVSSVAQTLEYSISELDTVERVVPHLRSRGKDLQVLLEVDTAPGANIPVLSQQVIDRALLLLEGELGLKVHGEIRLDISYKPRAAAQAPIRPVAGPAPVRPVPSAPAGTERVTYPETKPAPESPAPPTEVPTRATPQEVPEAAETPSEEPAEPGAAPKEIKVTMPQVDIFKEGEEKTEAERQDEIEEKGEEAPSEKDEDEKSPYSW